MGTPAGAGPVRLEDRRVPDPRGRGPAPQSGAGGAGAGDGPVRGTAGLSDDAGSPRPPPHAGHFGGKSRSPPPGDPGRRRRAGALDRSGGRRAWGHRGNRPLRRGAPLLPRPGLPRARKRRPRGAHHPSRARSLRRGGHGGTQSAARDGRLGRGQQSAVRLRSHGHPAARPRRWRRLSHALRPPRPRHPPPPDARPGHRSRRYRRLARERGGERRLGAPPALPGDRAGPPARRRHGGRGRGKLSRSRASAPARGLGEHSSRPLRAQRPPPRGPTPRPAPTRTPSCENAI